jgi:four helix bundle protein
MAAKVTSFHDLKVWQKAMDLVPETYRVTAKLPRSEMFSLGDQMRRAAVSIPANIAEGHGRQHTKEFLQHLAIARGSLAELHTLLLVAQRLKFLGADDIRVGETAIQTVRMLLYGLIGRLQSKV